MGSTAATELLGEERYSRLRRRHDDLFLRLMASSATGAVVKHIGDSFLCVFAEPSEAVLRAIEFQRALHRHRAELTDGDFRVHVRIGVHMGQVVMEKVLQADVFGGHVNRAARIEAAATAGLVLTSHAVFENSIGWLKGLVETGVKHRQFGKVRLKGIGESEELFGFHPAELPDPAVPSLVLARRRRRVALALIPVMVLLAATSGWWLTRDKISQVPATTENRHGPLFVQFDLDPRTANRFAGLDTTALKRSIMSRAITALHPYRVIDEEVLSRSLATQGRLLEHREVNGTQNRSYFVDTLGLGGILSVAFSDQQASIDSMELLMRLVLFDEDGGSSAAGRHVTMSRDGAIGRFSETLRDMYMSATTWTIQAKVTSVQDDRVAFVLESGSLLVKGTPIRFMREYVGEVGYRRWAGRIQEKLAFYRASGDHGEVVGSLERDSAEWAERMDKDIGHVAYGIEVEGQVTEVFDSTGVAGWWRTEEHPVRPEPGDLIYLRY